MRTAWCDGRREDDGECGGIQCSPTAEILSRSQSKMRGDCLFYEEKIGTTEAEKQAKAVRRLVVQSSLTVDINCI